MIFPSSSAMVNNGFVSRNALKRAQLQQIPFHDKNGDNEDDFGDDDVEDANYADDGDDDDDADEDDMPRLVDQGECPLS